MIDRSKAVHMLTDAVVTPLVTQSEQALHHAMTELELLACRLESGKWTDGLQKTSVWPDLVSVQATSSKAVEGHHHLRQTGQFDEGSRKPPMFARFFWLGACGVADGARHRCCCQGQTHAFLRNDRAPRGGLTCRIAHSAARKSMTRQSASKKIEATCQTCLGPSSNATNWLSS